MHGQCRAAAVRDAGDGAAQGAGAVMTLHDKHQVWRKLDPDQFSARVETQFFAVGPSPDPVLAHGVQAAVTLWPGLRADRAETNAAAVGLYALSRLADAVPLSVIGKRPTLAPY